MTLDAVFFFAATALILQSLIALADGARFLGFVRRRLAEPLADFAPPATLLCPLKGVDREMDLNLRALLEQDYPDYEVLFIVADAADPARTFAEQVIAGAARPARIVVAGPPQGRGEKVNNLLAGIAAARAESQVFVFADSDGRPPRRWMRTLVSYLADPAAGAASTFRWYVPAGGFLSGLQSAWNGPAVTHQGEWGWNFCWGGGTAIRRATFFAVDAPRYWARALSDDLMLTKALRAAGKRVTFVPQCLVVTRDRPSWAGLLDWTSRQVLLIRVYEPRLWWSALGVHVYYCLVLLFGFGLAALAARAGRWADAGLILATLAAIAALSVAKGVYRLAAVLLLLPEHSAELRRAWWSPTLQAALAPWLLAWNLLASAFTRRMTWRGVAYELRSPWETVVVR